VTYLLAQEIADLDSISIILDDAVNGKMSINCAHLVLEALEQKSGTAELQVAMGTDLRHTDNHVVNQTTDCAQASDMLATSLPDCEADLGGLALQ
jgi:hypothetical protein